MIKLAVSSALDCRKPVTTDTQHLVRMDEWVRMHWDNYKSAARGVDQLPGWLSVVFRKTV